MSRAKGVGREGNEAEMGAGEYGPEGKNLSAVALCFSEKSQHLCNGESQAE